MFDHSTLPFDSICVHLVSQFNYRELVTVDGVMRMSRGREVFPKKEKEKERELDIEIELA